MPKSAQLMTRNVHSYLTNSKVTQQENVRIFRKEQFYSTFISQTHAISTKMVPRFLQNCASNEIYIF